MNHLVSILACCLAFAGTRAAYGMDVAIVVNKDNPINELSIRELTAVFELQQQFWKGGSKVRVIMQKAGCRERKVMLKNVYYRTDESLNKYWLIRMFKAEIADLPEIEASNEKVKQVVSKHVDAIGFIDASKVDDTVKVLKIDGLLPGAEKYRMKSEDDQS